MCVCVCVVEGWCLRVCWILFLTPYPPLFLPDTTRPTCGRLGGRLLVWDLETAEVVANHEIGGSTVARTLALESGTSVLLAPGEKHSIVIRDMRSGTCAWAKGGRWRVPVCLWWPRIGLGGWGGAYSLVDTSRTWRYAVVQARWRVRSRGTPAQSFHSRSAEHTWPLAPPTTRRCYGTSAPPIGCGICVCVFVCMCVCVCVCVCASRVIWFVLRLKSDGRGGGGRAWGARC